MSDDTWQPIETAPMNGEPIWVICEDGTMGQDSLIRIGVWDINGNLIDDPTIKQDGSDEGVGWEWWCEAPSRRIGWRRE